MNLTKVEYDKYPNGEYFYLILKQSDPRLQNSNSDLPNEGEPYDTTRSRLLNLDFILRNIRSFYQEILNHILLIKLPDIYQIAKYPESEDTFKEMEKMLLLLLGLAINGEYKEQFVEKIQHNLETQVQMQLVPYIQLVTEDLSFSISKTLLLHISQNRASSQEKNGITSPVHKLPNLNVDINSDQASNSQHSPRDVSSSSTTSFTQACHQLQLEKGPGHTNNTLVLHYQTVDQFNYFLNNKLMPNMQRIVDERDSYLESIIELEQDKDYLAYRMKNPEYGGASASDTTNIPIQHEKNFKSDDVNLKNLTINELIINMVNNSSTICNMTNDNGSQIDPATGLIDMNDTNMKLLKLIDSINKHGLMDKETSSEEYYETMLNDINSKTKSKGLQMAETILSDLKSKKELACNWNQKIAIELVECKIRLKQLINEM